MNEEETEELAGGSSEDGSLQDHMAHWVEVLDRWIRRVDLGMGRQEDGAEEPDAEGDGDREVLRLLGEDADPAKDVDS